MALSAPAVAYCAIGGIILYSGIKGSSISDTVKAALKGNLNVTDTETIGTPASASAPGDTGAANAGASANQALAKQIAAQLGHADWTTGQEWQDWVSLWNQESGWNTDAANPTSNARGIAQNINGYGPDYLEGNAESQITWGVNYIAQRYGSPSLAWGHETQNGWY
jgi:resuscitation-promoting factor RpfB